MELIIHPSNLPIITKIININLSMLMLLIFMKDRLFENKNMKLEFYNIMF